MTLRSYRVEIRWQHRRQGPQREVTTAIASSVRRAINRALQIFFSDPQRRKDRRDAHPNIEVRAWRLPQKH